MKKTLNLGILVFDDAEVLDFCGPFEVFSVAGQQAEIPAFNVFTVAATKTPVTACNGLSVNPDYGFHNCPALNVLLVPGGIGTRSLLQNKTTVDWIRQQAEKADLTLSVCTGALLLGKAGLLKHLDVTTHHCAFDLLSDIVPTATVHRNRRYIDNGGVVTSAGIAAGIDMSLHIVARLLGPAVANATARQMEYPWNASQQLVSATNGSDESIRAITPKDLPGVNDLSIASKAHWGYTDEQMAVFRQELTMSPADLEFRIAQGILQDEEIVGYYTIGAGNDGSFVLEHLFVAPAFLRNGFGTRLLRHAMFQCQSLGIRQLVVFSDPNALGFYEKNGARFVKNIPSSIPGRSIPLVYIDLPDGERQQT